MKVVLLNSGGLDSALLGKLLKDEGHEVHSLFVDSGQLGVEGQKVAAKETADRYCASHFVLSVNWGRTPNHYENEEVNVMYDDGPADAKLWSGPPNMGLFLSSVGVSYAKMIDAERVYAGFKKNIYPDFAVKYNDLALMNTIARFRPQLVVPFGSVDTIEEELTLANAKIEDFGYVAKSVPEV